MPPAGHFSGIPGAKFRALEGLSFRNQSFVEGVKKSEKDWNWRWEGLFHKPVSKTFIS